MPRKWHSEKEIVYALQQAEGGKRVSEICRELGVWQASCNWKRRYAGHVLTGLRGLRLLREENHKLKTLVRDLTLDTNIWQEGLPNKV